MLDEIVSLAGADLAGQRSRDLGRVDVVDRDLDIVGVAPGFGEGIEPLIVAGHEVAPLQDLELGAGDVTGGGGLLRRGLDCEAGRERQGGADRESTRAFEQSATGPRPTGEILAHRGSSFVQR